ncbi:cytochrome-c peroxidase [Ramlibacter sp. G-1-2-2]|uniref:Cytochrome-c peroxidase n=1 Tax=Ramlibacter agri TaxID=2728837 RepID=A0A848H1T5_9BURK|nr:cytochrome c peroxidase [Ramlibacter agri]NML43622.1 cytochrome-c peroxidase [Ramlibacter agri]
MRIHLSIAALALLLLASCGGGSRSGTATTTAPATPVAAAVNLSAKAQVGQKIFFDRSLSASGAMSCASCHDPDHAYGPPNDLSVQLGGPNMNTPGTRAVPSLRYKDVTPPYADLLDNPDGVSVPGPGGGFDWDGRAPTLAEQARFPLLAAHEMANVTAAAFAVKLRKVAYAAQFQQAFGANALADDDGALAFATQALQAFQLEDPSFHPYSSKFDLYAGNKIGGTLTAAEQRGMKVFTDAGRGNCASCHYQGAGLNGSSALFTDFSYEAISVPRNMAIPANQDPAWFDMGVCGPIRTDHLPTAPGAANAFCGMVKAPTLRNVAKRTSFFHNGVMHSLEQVVRFYNTRDTMPQLWYPTVGGTPKATPDADFPTWGLVTTQYVGGTVQKFNDLPAAYRANIDPQMPLDGRAAGSANPMSERDIADLVCFLQTLDDGYQPPATPAKSGTCVD